MSTDRTGSEADRAAAEAERWLARMADGEVSPAERRAFEDWLAGSPANRAAYEELRAIWESPHLTAALRAAGVRSRRSWQVPLGLAAAAAIVAVTLTWFRTDVSGRHDSSVAYETVVGERRTVQLTDGSKLVLNTATRLEVTFGEDMRHVRLGEGEVYLDVQRDGRPFVVEGGTGRITVLGTAFGVHVSGSEMDVAVERGRVAVSPAGAQRAGQVLQPGQALTVHDGQVGAIRLTSGEIADWRDGWLDFSNESLARVVRELSRYHAGEIHLARDELAQLQVTGRINLADVDHAVRVLARSLGLQIRTAPSGEITIDR